MNRKQALGALAGAVASLFGVRDAKAAPKYPAFLEVGLLIPVAPGHWRRVRSIKFGDPTTVTLERVEERGVTLDAETIQYRMVVDKFYSQNPDRAAFVRHLERHVELATRETLRLYDAMHTP